MISQRCPKCHSDRIRRGYRPTPFWSKIVFRYYLLCNECNWSFAGFAVPGTVGKENSHRRKKLTPVERTETERIVVEGTPAVERTPAKDIPADELAVELGASATDGVEAAPVDPVVAELIVTDASAVKKKKRKKKNAKR